LEIAATASGLVSVWLNAKENVWGWVWGLVCVALYAYIFWEAKLFADAGLQVAFGASSVYGIWAWTRRGTEKALHPVTRTSLREGISLALFALAGSGGLGWFLATQTEDPRPWVDAALTAGSLVAQYQLARKQIENWFVWIAVDVVYVFLYLDRELYYTSFLYAAYIGLAIYGYRRWKRASGEAAQGKRAMIGKL
jgi:nicotinamide mononucleotide transporter